MWLKITGVLIGIILTILASFGNFALNTINKNIMGVALKMDKQYDQIEVRMIKQNDRISRVEDVQLDRNGTGRKLIETVKKEFEGFKYEFYELKRYVYGGKE